MADFVGTVDVMLSRLKGLRNMPMEAGAALRQETEIEATECKKRCPVWNSDREVPPNVVPGTLRASIHAEGPEIERGSIKCWIVAGGAAEDYALTVHEDLEAFHKVGEAKFIEGPLNESAPTLLGRVAARIDKNFGGR